MVEAFSRHAILQLCRGVRRRGGSGDLEKIRRLSRQAMQTDGGGVPQGAYAALVAALGRGGEYGLARDVYRAAQRRGEVGGPLLSAYLEVSLAQRDYEQAADAASGVLLAGASMDERLMAPLMQLLHHSGHAERAAHLYQRARDAGFAPSVPFLNRLVRLRAQDGDGDGVEALLLEMERLGMRANVLTYSGILGAFVRRGNMAEAERWREKLAAHGLAANEGVYATLVRGYLEAGNLQKAENVLEDMEAAGVPKGERMYAALIEGHALAARSCERAAELLEQMKEEGVPRSASVYAPLIRAYLRRQWFEKAREWYRAMVRDGVCPPASVASSLLGNYARLGLRDRLLDCLLELEADAAVLNEQVFLLIARSWLHAGHPQDSRLRDALAASLTRRKIPATRTLDLLSRAPRRGATIASAPSDSNSCPSSSPPS